jgi:cytochrome c556
MRFVSCAAVYACVLLTCSCDWQAGQANNSQGNISNESRSGNEAAGNMEARLSLGDATRVMHARHEGMETIGKNNKVVSRELRASSPDMGAVRSAAANIAKLSFEAGAWFPQGTGPAVGKTGAKADIWLPQNKADFATKLHNFQVAAPKFQAAAAGNDLAATKARYAELGATCKACHDKYRAEMKH